MEVEKRSSKGGFLQLFDWNVKSRKKFSDKSDLPDGSKQGKENFEGSVMLGLQQIMVYENKASPISRGQNADRGDLSAKHDEACMRPPGVVARLMGLDSLPNLNFYEPLLTPCLECSIRTQMSHTNDAEFRTEYRHGNMQTKLDGFSRSPVEAKLQKTHTCPIERFQTEIVPLKSAASIPITHNKLLSPIKGPGFIPTRNPAYIMEAAAKIIEHSNTNSKSPSFVSTSVPLRLNCLKGKMESSVQKGSRLPEACKRQKELCPAKYLKKSSERSQISPEDVQSFRAPMVSRRGYSESSMSKGKSIAIAFQAKANVQRREEVASSTNRSSINQKVVNEVISCQLDKNQTDTKNSVKKHSASRTSDALHQNNRKQNCAFIKDSLSAKSSNQQHKKGRHINGSSRSGKGNKVAVNSTTGTRKTNLGANGTRERSKSKTEIFPGKNQYIDGDVHINDSVVVNEPIYDSERSVKCNISIDGHMNWDAIDTKIGMDVISFTFTSPINKSGGGLQLSDQAMERNRSLSLNTNDDQSSLCSTISPERSNVIGSDALSALLDQKLKKLSCRVEPSPANMVKEGSFSYSGITLQDSVSSPEDVNILPIEYVRLLEVAQYMNKTNIQHDLDCSLVDELLLKGKQNLQSLEETAEHESSSNISEYGKTFGCQTSPVSSLEPSFSDGNYNSCDNQTSIGSIGSKQCSSVKAHETVNSMSTWKFKSMEIETELLDSASSGLYRGAYEEDIAILERPNWEVKYVRNILDNADLISNDFTLDQIHEIINPDLFDQLENQRTGSDTDVDEQLQIGRKVLFECVTECLKFRWELMSGGSYRAWVKGTAGFERKEWVVEEIYKELCGWTEMEELMVDELVDKDMSSQFGKWVDFETEAFEEGVGIEKQILTSLVEELVADLFILT